MPETATLLLRLAGPMQSWGSQSRFDQRDTEREPTKSGVLGLVCAALGKPRDDRAGPWPRLAELVALRMGIRVLREGAMKLDYQTAGGGAFAGRSNYGVWKASGGVRPVVSQRHYLSDADFLVALEGSERLLVRVEEALRDPVWQMSLGRKSYVPSLPIALPDKPPEGPGIRREALESALRSFQTSDRRLEKSQRVVLEIPRAEAVEIRCDIPLSFKDRSFAVRGVRTEWIAVNHD